MVIILEKGDFIRSRKNGKIYWIVEIDYKTERYVLEYMIKAGNSFEEDEKGRVGFDFSEVRSNFDEEKH